MKMSRSLYVLALFGIAACQGAQGPKPAGPPTDAEKAQMEERISQYYRKMTNAGPEITIKLANVTPADDPALLKATLVASNNESAQQLPLLISRDGRFFTQGQLIDLNVDPFQMVMSRINVSNVPMRGNPDAKVTIVEYSDFQCPYCGRAYKTLEDEVMKEYGDKVRLVYKNFPLSDIHPWADSAALASACARKQSAEGFWKMYNFLFQNQEAITPENVKEKTEGVIKESGLDAAAFDKCFDGKDAQDLVTADQSEAETLGVNSTPTFFINGRRLEGALPIDDFKAALDLAIKNAA